MVFTALDGSLLDARTFSYEAAKASLRRLAAGGVPVIPVTTRTFAEARSLAERLDIEGPIVIEAGGGIARRVGSSWRVEACAVETKRLRAAVPLIERRTSARLRLYSSMRLDEAAVASGLTGMDLRRSMQRHFDEPFLLESGTLDEVVRAAEALGLRVRSSGRFHHLSGASDKGCAAQRVRDEIARSLGVPPFVVALGVSPMDADFLALADVPIIVPRADGTADPFLRALLPEAKLAPVAGPRGWANAIDEIARNLGAVVGRESGRDHAATS
ncbi:MAG TPA: HAD hydrolase family protein [Thermoanaerobaculia bacterium]|nr:HAD hydrolase family protein [Thermoanaerobaculia bacterium]